MKNFLKRLGTLGLAGIIALSAFAPVASAQTVVNGLWKRTGPALLPTQSSYTIGSTSTRILKGWFTDLDVSGTFTFGGALSGSLDLDGNPLILDADGDSSLTADTDDQLDLALGGTDVITATGSAWQYLNGQSFTGLASSYACGRNNDATNRYQCNVPTGAIFEWSVNDSLAAFLSSTGFAVNNIGNTSSYNNSEIALGSTGAIVRRNVADSNPALTSTLTNAGSTGPIFRGVNSSGTAFEFGPAGALVFSQDSTLVSTNHELRRTSAGLFMQAPSGKQVGMLSGTAGFTVTNAIYTSVPLSNSASTNNATITMATTGTQVARNVADSNPALKVTQTNASSTGNIFTGTNSGGDVFAVNVSGNAQFLSNSSVDSTKNEIARISGSTNYNAPSGGSHLFGVNGGTTFTVSDGGLAYTATANEYFNITASNHSATDGIVYVALGANAEGVRGFSVENTLNGDYTDVRNYDGYLVGPSAGLTGQAAVYWGEIENNANDVSGSIYSVFRAVDVTDNGGSGATAVVHGGDSYDFFAVVGSGSIFAIDNATFGITAQNNGDSDRNGYDMPFVAESGTDSGATQRNGGSFTFKPGDQVNGGDVGTFKIVEAGAGSAYLQFSHDGTDAQYNTSTGIHTFNQIVRAKAGVRTRVSTADVSNPPTDAELDSAFGDPTTLGSGWCGVVDDNDAGTTFYHVCTTGNAGEWFTSAAYSLAL